MRAILYNDDNINIFNKLAYEDNIRFDAIYADMIYENEEFTWLEWCLNLLSRTGVLLVQTDYHTVAQVKDFIDSYGSFTFVNWCIYIQEWGGTPRKGFPRKHDDILIYAASPDYKWYGDRIQIPKKTAGTAFDKKGTGLKTPCDVFYDLGNFSTMDKERVKLNGYNISWQKPLKLMNRLLLPFTDENDYILDPFMGTGTTGVWAKKNRRNFFGIEKNRILYEIAEERIENA